VNISRRVVVPALLVIVAVLVTSGALLLVGPGALGQPGSSPGTSTSPSPLALAPEHPADPLPVTIRDFIFETERVRSPTAQKAQSKLWYAEGAWWAGLLAPSSDRIKIFRLDWARQTWVDTGTIVDERASADPDYLAVGDRLYVASAGTRPTSSSAARFLRFTYDASAKRYIRDPDFPVRITDIGTNAIVIARDGAKRLWITFVEAGKVMVAHTDGNDAHWSAPYAVPGSGTLRAEDISSVIAFGPGRIGVMWSDQQRQKMLFSSHADGESDDAWTPVEVVAEGAGSADNHLNLKTFERDGKELIAAAVKTSRDVVTDPNPLDPQILVMIRTDDGVWTGYEAGLVADKHSRPIVLIDEVRRLLYVAAQSPFGGGAIYVKRTDLDQPVFPTGKGDPLIASTKDLEIANPTSTKGSISPDTGLVVMASDNGSGRYLHAALDLGGTPIPSGVASIARPDRPPVTDGGPYRIVDDTFDASAVGGDAGNGWTDTESGGQASVQAAGKRQFLRLATSKTGQSAQSCKDIGRGGTTIVVDARVRSRVTGKGEARPLSVRGAGGEIAGLRVAADGTFAYFDGTKRIRTTRHLDDASWYAARITVDVAKKRVAIRLTDAAGRSLVAVSGLHWRIPTAVEPRDVCIRATGAASTIDLDTLQVSR
jgi:hypothetical protein